MPWNRARAQAEANPVRNRLFSGFSSSHGVCGFPGRDLRASLIPTYVAPQIGEDPSAKTRFEEFFEERLQELLAGQIPASACQDYRVKFGTPADGILQAAAEENVDLIVMGVRGAGSLVRAAHHLGATADRVVSESCCPVLTVRGLG